jgi:hypothetical protein
MALNEMAEMKT